jgi:hypothetical protein
MSDRTVATLPLRKRCPVQLRRLCLGVTPVSSSGWSVETTFEATG